MLYRSIGGILYFVILGTHFVAVVTMSSTVKNLVKHRTLTSLRQKSFCYRVVDHWNNLTEEIVTAKTVTSFKTLLDKHLVNECFDTFEIY